MSGARQHGELTNKQVILANMAMSALVDAAREHKASYADVHMALMAVSVKVDQLISTMVSDAKFAEEKSPNIIVPELRVNGPLRDRAR